MREMIFNDASVLNSNSPLADVAPMLADVAIGMASLVQSNCVSRALRLRRYLFEIACATDGSLFDAIELLRQVRTRDEHLFLVRLAQKAPLLADLPDAVVSQVQGAEAANVDQGAGESLVLCVKMRGVAISLPLKEEWDRDQCNVSFNELVESGEIRESTNEIDNLARSNHATPILERQRQREIEQLEPITFWENRNQLFPRLQFGPEVERQIAEVNRAVFSAVVNRIDEIHMSAKDWDSIGGAAPPWRCNVTPESEPTMNNRRLREARRFRSSLGSAELFEWHARYGDAGRIHLRFDPRNRSVEIGYIGGHLPLA